MMLGDDVSVQGASTVVKSQPSPNPGEAAPDGTVSAMATEHELTASGSGHTGATEDVSSVSNEPLVDEAASADTAATAKILTSEGDVGSPSDHPVTELSAAADADATAEEHGTGDDSEIGIGTDDVTAKNQDMSETTTALPDSAINATNTEGTETDAVEGTEVDEGIDSAPASKITSGSSLFDEDDDDDEDDRTYVPEVPLDGKRKSRTRAPRKKTEKQLKRENLELHKQASKMRRESASEGLKVKMPEKRKSVPPVLAQAAPARKSSGGKSKWVALKATVAAAAALKKDAPNAAPKLGGGHNFVPTRSKSRRGVDDMLQNGTQITLVPEEAVKASPRKLARMGYKVQTQTLVRIGIEVKTEQSGPKVSPLKYDGAGKARLKFRRSIMDQVANQTKEKIQRHKDLTRLDEEEGFDMAAANAEVNGDEMEADITEEGEEDGDGDEDGEKEGDDAEGSQSDSDGGTPVDANPNSPDNATTDSAPAPTNDDTMELDKDLPGEAPAETAAITEAGEPAPLPEVPNIEPNQNLPAEEQDRTATTTTTDCDPEVPKPGSKMDPRDFFKNSKVTATAAVAVSKVSDVADSMAAHRGSPDLFEGQGGAGAAVGDAAPAAADGSSRPPIIRTYERKRSAVAAIEPGAAAADGPDDANPGSQSQVLDDNGFVVSREAKKPKTNPFATVKSRCDDTTAAAGPSQTAMDDDDALDELIGMCSGAFDEAPNLAAPNKLPSIPDEEEARGAEEAEEAETEDMELSAVYAEEFGAEDGTGGFVIEEADVSGESDDEAEEAQDADESDSGDAFSDADEGNNFDRLRLDAAADEAADTGFLANLVKRHVYRDEEDDSDVEERKAKRAAEETTRAERDAEARKQRKAEKKRRRKERKERKKREALEKAKSEDSQRDLFASDNEAEAATVISEPDSSGDEDEKAREAERMEKENWLRSNEQEHSRMTLMSELQLDSRSLSRVEDLRAPSRTRSGSALVIEEDSGTGTAAAAPPKALFAGIGKGGANLAPPKKVVRRPSRSYLEVAKKSNAWATAAGAAKKAKKSSGGSFIFDVSRDGMSRDGFDESNSRSSAAPTRTTSGGAPSFAGRFSKHTAVSRLSGPAASSAKTSKATKTAAALTKRRSKLIAGLNKM